jgi:hypothetical protein
MQESDLVSVSKSESRCLVIGIDIKVITVTGEESLLLLPAKLKECTEEEK